MHRHLVHLGTQRAGSTFLYHLMRQLPDVSIARAQELGFFRHEPVGSYDDYLGQFTGRRDVLFENSPFYFRSSAETAPRLAAFFQNRPLRISLSLRDPIEYLLSLHKMKRRQQFSPETAGFQGSTDDLIDFCRQNPTYLDRCRYATLLETHWFPRFEREQMDIFLFEDLIADPRRTLERLCSRVGVDVPANLNTEVFTNAEPRSSAVQTLRRVTAQTPWLRTLATKVRATPVLRSAIVKMTFKSGPGAPSPAAPKEDDRKLVDFLQNELGGEVERLKAILGRDALPWKNFA